MSDSKHTFFFHGQSIYSNWHMKDFELYGQKFNCGEQAMMWAKAMLFGDTEKAEEILEAKTPKEQKALGKQVKPFDQTFWDAVKTRMMYTVVAAKFEGDKDYQYELRKTGETMLVEASPYDKVWGIGLDEKKAKQTPEQNWPGQNLLGKMLTKYRNDHVKDQVKQMSLDDLTKVGVKAVQKKSGYDMSM